MGKMIKNNKIVISILCISILIVGLLLLKNIYDNRNEENVVIDDAKQPKISTNNEEKVSQFAKIDNYKSENEDRYRDYKQKNSDLSDEKIVLYVNIGIDREFYTDVSESPNQNDNTILVNKYYHLDKNYVPSDLEDIKAIYQVGGKKMKHDAAIAFNEMAEQAKKEGYTIRAVSTYRSYDYQDNLYNRYVQNDGKEKADTYSARAGFSEHQTGLAADIDNGKMSYTNFGITNEFSWMQNNAHKFGYILRYTKENQFITGYVDEPWHYRYVGIDIATKMKEENINSYEEYYARYLDE